MKKIIVTILCVASLSLAATAGDSCSDKSGLSRTGCQVGNATRNAADRIGSAAKSGYESGREWWGGHKDEVREKAGEAARKSAEAARKAADGMKNFIGGFRDGFRR